MPEQIKPSTLDQVLAGKPHDLTYPLAILWLVAMYVAMLAGRLFLQRAAQSTLKGVKKKIRAFLADRRPLQRQELQLRLISCQDCLGTVMLYSTVDCSELQQHLEVLDLFAGQ